MKPEQQRIAIAEACGWKKCRTEQGHLAWGCDPDTGYEQKLPNYLGDLNAMHEAEKVLGEKRIRSYTFTLAQALDTSPTVDLDDQFLNIHATAPQRAEAFLRVHGKWEESS